MSVKAGVLFTVATVWVYVDRRCLRNIYYVEKGSVCGASAARMRYGHGAGAVREAWRGGGCTRLCLRPDYALSI